MSFIFDDNKKSGSEVLMVFIKALLLISFSISILVWFLSLLLWITELFVGCFGYSYSIPSGVQTAAITVSGTIVVALVALYGVYKQNLSAEKRHRVDANLSLKKDIFLKVAESFSLQYEYILSFANPVFTDEDRVALMKGYSKEFYKLQFVASQKTIIAMLSVNKEWSKIVFEVSLMKQKNELTNIDFLKYLVETSHGFMNKLWEFNVCARSEFENPFHDNDSYFLEMNKSYEDLIGIINNLKLKINENNF